MPAGSKMDLPLAKAEPISDSGSASGITYLRREKKQQEKLQPERGVRICERNNSADTKPMEDDGGADIHLQPIEDPMLEQVEAPEGGRDPVESPRWSGFAGRTCDPEGDPRWSSLILKDCTPWKGPTLEQFVKNCSLWEGLMLKKLVEDCLSWEGPHIGAGEQCGGVLPLRRKEQQRQCVMN
ncbi:zinc finger and BTB domain-containing protein 5 [Grus japonensis]|uniref:Zinc finger and BTB domain-containing protein 5 n=1 Tax=Grus japonensis TaxID=30415 RepID=A0ABC9WVN3_GRUJA